MNICPLPNYILQDLRDELEKLKGVDGALLAGSAATGELLWEKDTVGTTKLVSDVEVAVLSGEASIRDRLRLVEARLRKRHDIDFELFWVNARRWGGGLSRNQSFGERTPDLLMSDLYLTESWILEPKCRGAWPRFTAQIEPSIWEGQRLILNRLAEGCRYLLNSDDPLQRDRWAIKLLLACGDHILISSRQYSAGYANRGLAFNRLERLESVSDVFWAQIKKSYQIRSGKVAEFNFEGRELIKNSLLLLVDHSPLSEVNVNKLFEKYTCRYHLYSGWWNHKFESYLLLLSKFRFQNRLHFSLAARSILSTQSISRKSFQQIFSLLRDLVVGEKKKASLSKEIEAVESVWNAYCK